MSGTIPRKSSDCVWCVRDGVCQYHRGSGGNAIEYTGPEMYEPTEWIQEVVGQHFTGVDWKLEARRTWLCTGYDPRCGFWLVTVDDLGPERLTNVSERAIGSTFHKVKSSVI